MPPEIFGDTRADFLLFALSLAGWIILIGFIYAPRERGIWWLEAVARALVATILGGLVANLFGYRGTTSTAAAWLLGALAVAVSKPR